jgi:ketosteroid isomerase-like protein
VGEHRNVARIRSALDVYNSGDYDVMKAFLADDIVWHVGGNHALSGDYEGVDAVLGYFHDVRRATAGTLQVEAEEILANDRHASIFMHVTAHRDVRRLDVLLAEALTLDDQGRWSEYWALSNDQGAVDAFWA